MLELALLTPVFILMIFVVVGLGRFGVARGTVDAVARDAARAASISRSAADASAAARAAANEALAGHDLTCEDMDVVVDTAEFRPGGWVAVDLTCRVRLADVAGVWAPGSSTFEARAVAVIDTYRRAG